MKDRMEKMKSIAENFESFIKGKTFGFVGKSDSLDEEIIRYQEGIERISDLTGISVSELEKNRELNVDDGLVDVRLRYEDIVFEYTFPDTNFEDDIDTEHGWWKIFYIDDNGSFENIDMLYDAWEHECEAD